MIKNKRTSLEQFIKEQLIGPGGCKDLYSIKESPCEENNEPLGEVLNTTPGSIYSSAILFPVRKENNSSQQLERRENIDVVEISDDALEQENELEEISDFSDDEDEDINSLNRRFPTTIGISCCLNTEFINNNDLKIVISGRYYTKINKHSLLEVIVEDVEEFKKFFNDNASLFGEYFVLDENKVSLRHSIPQKSISSYKEKLRNLNVTITAFIAKNQNKSIDPIFMGLGEKYRFLSSYKERLFKKLSSIKDGDYLTTDEVDIIRKRIEKIEQYETFFAYIEDLVSICDDRNFGYWVEHPFVKEVDLSTLKLDINTEDGKVIYTPQKYTCLKDFFKVQITDTIAISLSAWLQLIRTKNNKIYLKILINNSSTEVVTDNQRYYSIVSEIVNERCFFGVTIDVSSKYLCQYKDIQSSNLDDDEAEKLRFLYRKVEDFGVGHFCSVDWMKDEYGIMHVHSEFMPKVETPDIEPIPRDKNNNIDSNGIVVPKPYLQDSQCLQFKWLSFFSSASDKDVVKALLEFVELYKKWIESQRNNINDIDNNEIATQNIKACEKDYERMRDNINEFLSDNDKMRVFRAMNAAMFMQLWHNKKDNQKKVRDEKIKLTLDFYRGVTDDIFPGVKHTAWRPFQLAFIILNLDGIFKSKRDPSWSKRNELVDLVWFPTGGGKTEAYLGIIALAIIHRRLAKGENGYGVTAIMRYTLRLLATQQFQRALRLILAIEQIRLWKLDQYNLGNEQISIGLFVGEQSLPNELTGLQDQARIWALRGDGNNNSKIPLDVCPWCGTKLVHVSERKSGVKFYCENINCTFDIHNAIIPVRLCDDDIYKYPPTLLFGTVDKFAQLAHRVNVNTPQKDSRRLFGRGNGWNKLTPDLIIQDELHLFMGPLGSAVSLYECAIDILCTREEDGKIVKPKIISSTATTRNTGLQVRALYDRDVSIFPKNGIDYDDSFFAFYKRSKDLKKDEWSFESKRKYIGIMPTGRTQMTTQMRIAAILFVHRAIYEKENISLLYDDKFIKSADYYYTTISYFNSLKEVGKTDAQFYMEFTKYTRRLFKRVMRYSNMLECLYAYNERFSKSELTGRLLGNEAIAALNNVQFLTWDPRRRFPYQDQGTWCRAIKPDDLILATNMISVGLDVSRFNVIIMNSMPRNIAEYIQASSRVARDKEGLVLTLHNPFRSRDVSHFEKYREFHEKLYYYVEPISITPFSQKSVEKYLPLLLGTCIRHLFLDLADNNDANNIDENLVQKIGSFFDMYFEKRYENTSKLDGLERELLTKELYDHIKAMTKEMLDEWLNKKLSSQNNSLVYNTYNTRNGRNNNVPLYLSPDEYDDNRQGNKWNVPTALRILEPEAVIHIIK